MKHEKNNRHGELQKRNKSEIVIHSKNDFVTLFEPVSMVMKFRHINSIEKAIKEDSNSCAYYVKSFGFDSVQAIIELHLLALNESVNVGKPLSEFQIKEISIEIITVFYMLSIIEIQYVLRKAKRGDYGKFYNSLNMPDILIWFNTYLDERTTHFINENTKHIQTDFTMRMEERKLLERHNKLNGENKD